jgi:hypothetical protein
MEDGGVRGDSGRETLEKEKEHARDESGEERNCFDFGWRGIHGGK